jgi:hypothetical protein
MDEIMGSTVNENDFLLSGAYDILHYIADIRERK